MALPEHKAQELVVGLYDRGVGLPSKQRVLDIGSSKILKSGIWSPYLVNMRPALSVDTESPQSIDRQKAVKSLLLDSISGEVDTLSESLGFFHIYGPPEAGTPLAGAVAGFGGHSLLWRRIIDKSGRGSHESLEGVYHAGQNVVQIDDVVTNAGTKAEEKALLENYGLGSPAAVVAFDREQGGAQALEALGMDFRAAIGATAAFGYLLDDKRITQTQHDYLAEYTVNPAPTTEPTDFSGLFPAS